MDGLIVTHLSRAEQARSPMTVVFGLSCSLGSILLSTGRLSGTPHINTHVVQEDDTATILPRFGVDLSVRSGSSIQRKK